MRIIRAKVERKLRDCLHTESLLHRVNKDDNSIPTHTPVELTSSQQKEAISVARDPYIVQEELTNLVWDFPDRRRRFVMLQPKGEIFVDGLHLNSSISASSNHFR